MIIKMRFIKQNDEIIIMEDIEIILEGTPDIVESLDSMINKYFSGKEWRKM